MPKKLPARKNTRLKEYDYSKAGRYFITICVKGKHEILGNVVGDAPLRVPQCVLSEYGVFVDEQIRKINTIYPSVSVNNYSIMPNHIHMIISIVDASGTRRGASPTKALVPRIIQSLKSMTTKQFGFNIWQRSYHDHIIRGEKNYQRIYQYIDENPARWEEDCYYTK